MLLGSGTSPPLKSLVGTVGASDTSEGSPFHPEHLFFTSSGRVGHTVRVDDEVALHLTALQRNMAKLMKGPGDISHTKCVRIFSCLFLRPLTAHRARAPTNSRGRTDAESAFGFLDGDFLEQFLTESRQAQILQGELEVERINLTLSDTEALLEKLQNLH